MRLQNITIISITVAVLFLGAVIGVQYKNDSFGASVLFPYQGGTGTSTPPTYGKVLLGNSSGRYDVVATSSLGITGVEALNDLTDVNTTGVAYGNLIFYNGASWEDVATSSLGITGSMTYPGAGIALSTGSAWGTSITNNSDNWNTAYDNRITSATYPLLISSNVISTAIATSTLVPYTGATANVDLGSYRLTVTNASTTNITASGYLNVTGATKVGGVFLLGNDFVVGATANYYFSDVSSPQNSDTFRVALGSSASSTINLSQSSDSAINEAILDLAGLTSNRIFTFPDQTGTFALTSDLSSYLLGSAYYATTTHPLISSLPSLSITKSQVSDFGTYENPLTFNYPLTRATNAISLAFGTTTSNTWAGTQTFANAPVLTSLGTPAGTFLAVDGSGLIIATTTPSGGWGALSDIPLNQGNIIVGNPSNVGSATTSLFISQAGNVGIGSSTPLSRLTIQGNGNNIMSIATTTGAVNTYNHLLSSNKDKFTFGPNLGTRLTSATLVEYTDYNGDNSDWSFRVAGSGWPVINFGKSRGTLDVPTVTLPTDVVSEIVSWHYTGSAWNQNSNIQTTFLNSPIASTTKIAFYTRENNVFDTSLPILTLLGNKIGIGTTTPYAKLSVVGEVVGSYFTATSTTATSTFPYLASTYSNLGTIIGGTWQGGTIGVAYGGTGSTTLSGLLKGNGTNMIATAVAGTDYLTTVASDATWTLHNSYPTACATGVVTGIGDTLTCTATSTLAIDLSNTTGTLPVNRGGTNLTSYTLNQLLYASGTGTIGQIATSSLGLSILDTTGTLTVAKGGTGSTTLSGLLKGNGTGAVMTAVAGTDYVIPSVTTLSSLVSVSTITTGTWNATAIATNYGGTGLGAGGLASTFIPFGNGTNAFATSSALYFTSGYSRLTATNASTTLLTVSGTSYLATLLGTIDAGGALSFEIPNSATLFTNIAGQIGIDTTSGQLRYNSGSATSTIVADHAWKPNIASTTITGRGGSVTATSTFLIPVDTRAFTITDILCFTDTATSSIRIGDGTNWTELVLCGSGGSVGEDDGSIANGSFTAKEKPKLEILNNYSGVPNETAITVKYIFDAD